MSIYRGAGGAGDAVADAASEASLIKTLAVEVQADADAAEAARVAAVAAKVAAELAETNAETAETNAETAETNAETAQAAAASSASAASTSASNAATSATNAANSATSASTSASTATTQATNASTSATAAAGSATAAASSANAASTSATNAASSATAAASSASSASTSATNAANSATAAAGSATSASSSASTATTQAGIATTQATNAANSATAAATSETNAATSATNASNSASTATTQATNASNSASAAATSATNASNSASSASTSATNAAASAAAAAASYDNFDDRYLGSKTSDPTVDNDGNALLTGALYYNTTDAVMKVYDGSQWIAASAASQAILVVYQYTATAGQTTFSGTDNNSLTLGYTVGSALVTLNGVILEVGTEVTATSGTSVVLANGASAGDELNVYAFSTFDLADVYTKAASDARYVNVSGDTMTGALLLPDGSAAAPALSNDGDTNTGMFFPAADTIAFAEGGAEVMRIDSSGNVGIGTSSPNYKLEVYNASNPRLSISSSNTGIGELRFSDPDLGYAGLIEYAHSSDSMRLYTAGTERMRIDSSGNLLVGKTSSSANGNGAQLFPSGTLGLGHTSGTVTGTAYAAFGYVGGGIGSITQNGTTGVLYNTSSDYRLKDVTGSLAGYKERIMALQPKQGSWKSDGSEFRGFIAHEFATQYPASVSGEKDAVDSEGKPIYQGMQAGGSETIADLVALAQEQQAQLTSMSLTLANANEIITDLTNRLTALENK